MKSDKIKILISSLLVIITICFFIYSLNENSGKYSKYKKYDKSVIYSGRIESVVKSRGNTVGFCIDTKCIYVTYLPNNKYNGVFKDFAQVVNHGDSIYFNPGANNELYLCKAPNTCYVYKISDDW